MKIYVAAPFSHHPRARAFAEKLVQQGHEITHPWWHEADNYPDGVSPFEAGQQHALQDLNGVRSADFVVGLTSEHKHEGCGLWIELGAALAFGKPFMVVGPQADRTIFARLGLRIDTDERALKVLERLSIDGLAVRQITSNSAFAVYSRLREYRQKGMTFDAERAEAQLERELAALDRMQAACGQL